MDDKLNDVLIKAETLIEALPYIRDFNNKKVVVKYGGSAMLDEKLQQSQSFASEAYDALQPYLTTSMAKGQLVNEAWAAKDYTRLDTIKPDGTYQVGEDGFMEFYPDADALQQAVLQLFYEKVE